MASKPAKPVLYKSISQIRYQPNLKYLGRLLSAAEKVTGYPDWETDHNTYTFKDFKRKCSFSFSGDVCHYEQDSGDISLEGDRVQEMVNVVLSGLSITQCARFGYRTKYLLPLDMGFEVLLKIMNVKFLSQNRKLVDSLPRVTDLLYRLDLAEERYGYHLTAGPMKKAEMRRHMELSPNNFPQPRVDAVKAVEAEYPDVAVYFDIDYYLGLGAYSPEEAGPFFVRAREKTRTLVQLLTNYLLDASPLEDKS